MNRVVHFEVHAKDMEKMLKFYQDVFGWNITDAGADYGGYRMIATGPGPDDMAKGVKMEDVGINGGMTPRVGDLPKPTDAVNAFVCIIGVENIDATIEKLKAAGATEAFAKMEVPHVGMLAYYRDPEENIFGVLQPGGMNQ
ncbi:MAG TPA: VOC family protein [Candidatus Paceibacterota bacterium]|nr:VOC family protein [Candidatus Paceibacterota bacterium]